MKDSTSWICPWLALLVFSLILPSLSVLANQDCQDDDTWENVLCIFGDEEIGICKKVGNCSTKFREINQGNYTAEENCGSSKFDELVCCEIEFIEETNNEQVRPAVAACDLYWHWWLANEVFIIIGGVDAIPGEFPQMVALGYPAGPDDELAIDGIQYICGGTLISQKHVLTAAHCVSNIHGFIPIEVAIMGTATDLNYIKAQPEIRVPISKITKHPEYRRSRNYHDIAVIELKTPVKFSRNVRPACLMTEPLSNSTERRDISLTVLGWGAIDIDDTRTSKLLKAEQLKSIETSECSISYGNIRAQLPNGLDEGMICVVDPDAQRRADTCKGDSGGPLFLGWKVFPELIGVTSFGQGCGVNTPGVYTSVYKYLDWIEAQVWADGAPNFVN